MYRPTHLSSFEHGRADLRDYLTCQKEKVSSTTLIAAGTGVTLGILILVGLGVWLCNRQRSSRRPSPHSSPPQRSSKKQETESEEEEESDSGEERPSSIRKTPPRGHDEERAVSKKKNPKILEKGPKGRVESVSSGSEWTITPPPPHPAHANLGNTPPRKQPTLPSQAIIESFPPTQPSRTFRQPGQPSQSRQMPTRPAITPLSIKRQSVATLSVKGDRPPMPPPARSNMGTRPLTIRKSTFNASPPTLNQSQQHNGLTKPIGTVPSYDEATRGQGTVQPVPGGRTSSAIARPVLGDMRSSSAPDGPPSLPLAHRIDARRPSVPLRRVSERGGMI